MSKRLEAIAQMVTPGNRLVDVGCDHGYLPIALVQCRKIPRAIAMDVREGPLSRARENIAAYGLDPYIETRLSDGLEALREKEGETLSIAGMGGPLMAKILSKGDKIVRSFRELILQPQSEVCEFRRYLWRRGLAIVEEDMVLEDGKFYTILKVVPEKSGQQEPYSDIEFYYGKFLLGGRNPVLYRYLRGEQEKNQRIRLGLQGNVNPNVQGRKRELLEEKRRIEAAMRYYENQ